jgi:hypothetical protein
VVVAKVIAEWDAPDLIDGNVQHIAKHNVTPAEVEYVLNSLRSQTSRSRRHGHPITFGRTKAGRYLAVVYEIKKTKPFTVKPITAYDVNLTEN